MAKDKTGHDTIIIDGKAGGGKHETKTINSGSKK